jgi:hypothetical protein
VRRRKKPSSCAYAVGLWDDVKLLDEHVAQTTLMRARNQHTLVERRPLFLLFSPGWTLEPGLKGLGATWPEKTGAPPPNPTLVSVGKTTRN